MKNKILIGALALVSMSLGSCNDILDEDPHNSFTAETVWSELSLSEAYLNAQYMNIRAESQNGTRFAHYTDEVYQMHTYGSENYTQGLLSPDNCGIGWDDGLWDPWHYYYQAINKINLFLEKIDGVPTVNEGDDTWRDQQKGQGLFLRAWYYHMLYSFFGRVPIIDHTYDLDATFGEKRQDMDKVADFIVSDLDKAAELLPVNYDSSDFGRATKGAALALKSRVLIYKASPLFGTPSNEKWRAAADAAKAVIDLGVYHLQPVSNSEEYGNLFLDAQNPEAIFVKQYDSKYGSGDNMCFLYQAPCGIGNGFEGWGNFQPTQNLVDKFQMADGSAPEVKSYYEEYPWSGREIRFYAAFLLDGDEWGYGSGHREIEVWYGEDGTNGRDSQWGPYWWNASKTGYSMRKFLDPNYDCRSTLMYTAPWFFIRYSEILLNYAECMIELGNNSEALQYINMIRNRALLPDATGADIRAEYDYERQIELVFEGNRWFDQRRWKKMYDEYSKPIYGMTVGRRADGSKYYMTNDENNIVSTRVFNNDKLYWLPVPRWELNRAPEIDAAPYE